MAVGKYMYTYSCFVILLSKDRANCLYHFYRIVKKKFTRFIKPAHTIHRKPAFLWGLTALEFLLLWRGSETEPKHKKERETLE